MIVQEHFTVNGIDYIRTYSDAGRYVVGGEPVGAYNEATDPAEFGRVYTEGELIDGDDLTPEEALDILMGVSE